MRSAIRSLLVSTSSRHRPWQIAAGLAVGSLCGFLPKFSFLFVLAALVLVGLPIHLPAAAAATLLVTAGLATIHPSLLSIYQQLGSRSLTHPQLQAVWLQLDAVPLLPWLGIHNLVVHGRLLVGLATCLGVYCLSWPLSVWLIGRGLRDQAQATHPDTDLRAATSAEDQPTGLSASPVSEQPTEETRDLACGQPAEIEPPLCSRDAGGREPPATLEQQSVSEALADAVAELESCLHSTDDLLDGGEEPQAANTDQVIRRAARVATLVDDILANLDDIDAPAAPAAAPTSEAARIDANASTLASPLQSAEVGDDPGVQPPEVSTASQPASHRAAPPKPAATASGSPAAAAEHKRRIVMYRADETEIEIAWDPARGSPSTATPAAAEDASVDSTMATFATGGRTPAQLGRPRTDRPRGTSTRLPASVAATDIAQGTATTATVARNSDATHTTHENEALRYLLLHLREFKEKVK